jgi:aminoglycoside phosphotransferase (APT) family kinase protein
MARRPYGLLHADLHRDNVVVTDHGDPHLVAVDWELATYGDPLHDLAVHLVRTRYTYLQRQEVVDAWVEAMLPVRPAATNGLAKDLRHYLAFERAQSVYSDVVRAARSLQRGPRGAGPDEEGLHRAARAVHTALDLGAGPLGLRTVPSASETEHVLYRWQASWRERSGGSAIVWRRDPRLPEHPVLPDRAVLHALVAEGAAPAGRVFRGTSHLNTVVHVPGVDLPLVVRRRLASVCRREPRFLSEHAVLRAVERSGAKVAAPRALALGSSHPDDQFAVHTYVGPLDSDRPPEHPVRGLLPHEADGLVRQLAELTRVDCGALDPAFSFFDPDAAAGDCGFCPWLVRQLVRMVAELPRPSQQLARSVGLPDATRLQEILAGHRVTPRRPALLHGDLNPWNLVRRPDAFALTIIDWEMAMVGDPLYDLVRHMHLTPTRPEIRERLFRTWETALPAEYTRDWRRDWRVYRRIEIVRSAYVDLDRFVTGTGLDTPNVRRALESYAMTLAAALAALGLRAGPLAGTSLAPAPPRGERPA